MKTRGWLSLGAAVVGGLLILALGVFAWRQVGLSSMPTPGEAPTGAPEVRTLRLGLNIAAGSALHAAALRFAEQVGERSQGRIKVAVYPDQQLGSDDQMLEMARGGQLDLLLTPTAKLSSAIPAMQYADLPFYFSSREELYAMLDGEPGQILLSRLNAIDLVGLTFWENGFKQFTANVPIRQPRDLAGLRMRTMKSRLIVDQFETLGAKGIPIDFHATYQALADGAVDGEENPLVAIVAMRFHEVQKHLTLSNHAYLGYVFSASRKTFESLPPDIRALILKTARELTLWEREETARREARFIDTIREAGVAIHELSPQERATFARAMAPLADKFAFEVGYDLLAKTEEIRFRQVMKDPGSPLVIGLDADLSKGGALAGGAIYRGVQLAVEETNVQGGVNGRQVRLVAMDHRASGGMGRQNIERFAAMPGLLGVIGGMHSAVIEEELPRIQQDRIPYIVPWASGLPANDNRPAPDYLFRVSASDQMVSPLLFGRALKEGGRVLVFLEQSAWGRSNEAVLKPLLEHLAPGTVQLEWVTMSDLSLVSRVQSLMAGNSVRAVVMVTNFMESLIIVQALAQLESSPPVFAHWGLTGGDFWKATQRELLRVDLRFVQTALTHEAALFPRIPAFIRHYRERFRLGPSERLPSPNGTIQAYDAARLLLLAARKARSTDREAIGRALESLPDYAGILRDYHPPFTRARHEALDNSNLYLARFDAQGHIVRAE